MANNCLITKLKESVNNPDLRKLGEMRLYITPEATITAPESQQGLTLYLRGPVTVSVSAGGAVGTSIADLANARTSLELQESNIIYFANVESTITISNKYNIRSVRNPNSAWIKNIVTFDYAEFAYVSLSDFMPFVVTKYGNIENFNMPGIINAEIGAQNAYGNFDKVATNFANAEIIGLANSNITGTISYFKSILTKVQHLYVSWCKVSGTIEEFVEAQAPIRQVNEHTYLGYFGSPITFHGQTTIDGTLGNLYILYTAEGATISLQSDKQTPIATYNKTTGIWNYEL